VYEIYEKNLKLGASHNRKLKTKWSDFTGIIQNVFKKKTFTIEIS